jgi:hypothetical protein
LAKTSNTITPISKAMIQMILFFIKFYFSSEVVMVVMVFII